MTLLASTRPGTAPADAASVREQLQARIRTMQSSRLPERSLPLLETLRPLLPEGLRAGATYSVTGSTSLALALLAQASQEGAWCGVLGMPHLGTEAAAGLGIELERLVLVPDPGTRWLPVVAAMTEVLGIVIATPMRISPGEASRLAARLRQRESTLIVLGPWPQADAVLRASGGDWSGLGRGHGHLTGRRLHVESIPRGGRSRTRVVPLPWEGTPPPPDHAGASTGRLHLAG